MPIGPQNNSLLQYTPPAAPRYYHYPEYYSALWLVVMREWQLKLLLYPQPPPMDKTRSELAMIVTGTQG